MSGRERNVRLTRRLGLALLENLETPAPGPDPLLLMRADSVFEERLAKELIKCPGVLPVAPSSAGLTALAACVESEQAAGAMELLRKEVLTETAIREAGLKPMQAADMVGLYDAALRKRAPPWAFRLMPSNTAQIEKITFDGAYKGVTDLVTKFIFPGPTFHITRLLSQTKTTPNVVTTASLVFTILFFPLVLNGYFLAGVGCIWAMALLDTVDGKLARVTLTSTQFGRVYDHGIDLVGVDGGGRPCRRQTGRATLHFDLWHQDTYLAQVRFQFSAHYRPTQPKPSDSYPLYRSGVPCRRLFGRRGLDPVPVQSRRAHGALSPGTRRAPERRGDHQLARGIDSTRSWPLLTG
ncbi:MAG: CDP-alcohol phosphatidyltransferase family protein [Sedimenticolaceae bacterium]